MRGYKCTLLAMVLGIVFVTMLQRGRWGGEGILRDAPECELIACIQDHL